MIPFSQNKLLEIETKKSLKKIIEDDQLIKERVKSGYYPSANL